MSERTWKMGSSFVVLSDNATLYEQSFHHDASMLAYKTGWFVTSERLINE